MKQAVIYEVRLEIDPGIAAEYDLWLAEHIAEMLHFDGFESAELLVPEDDSPGASANQTDIREGATPESGQPKKRIVRQVQYRVTSREHLQRYFNEHAERMREQGAKRFGDAVSASRIVYELGSRPARLCQNCNAGLRGQYCEECGQRDKYRIISLWELVRDLIGDLFEVDSRVWRTLRPLLFKPGRLTLEYLRGRRVRYTPPLRLYLISSLLFFLVIFFNATPNLTIDGESAELEEVVAAIEKSTEQADTDLPESPSHSSADSNYDPDQDLNPVPPDTPKDDSGGLSDRCEKIEMSDGPWTDEIEKRARQACRNLTAEGGAKRFIGDLIDNAPGMMFFFLPVIALIMALLYPLSRRYYVEHLLFFVHFHSFFFLILTLTVLFSRAPMVLPGQSFASALLTLVVTLYIPVYLFIAMRRVYGQSRALTAVKYAVLGVAYFVSLLTSFAAMALITALSV